MKDIVIIKVYRNDITCNEYHDTYNDAFEKIINETKRFANSIGKKVFFTVCTSLDCADFDTFAEIEYSGTLSKQEKDVYASLVNFFTRDAGIINNTLYIYDLPTSIFFKKSSLI